jgi:hypothetical protein
LALRRWAWDSRKARIVSEADPTSRTGTMEHRSDGQLQGFSASVRFAAAARLCRQTRRGFPGVVEYGVRAGVVDTQYRDVRENTMTGKRSADPAAAKHEIVEYCKRKGALAKSVIALGVGGQTRGAWSVPAKAMGYFGSTESRAYTIAYGCAFFIEGRFGAPTIYCPPDVDNKYGTRVPLQSLKLHAEVAGIGARSLAGDILLHPEFGYMYFASVFSELELPPDEPLAENPCPAPSCVKMYRQVGRTPCMKFCPVQCLSGSIDEHGVQAEMHYDMAACADLSEQYEALPVMLAEAARAENADEVLMDADNKLFWYKMSVGSGGLLAQCFECMRVCPIATQAPLADPIHRLQAAQRDTGES